MVDSIIQRSLELAANEAIFSFELSEHQAFRLVSSFESLLEPFILSQNYSADKIRAAVRECVDDSVLASIITKCADYLEEAFEKAPEVSDNVTRYVQFVSLIVDSKFLNWYVRSGTIAGPLSRLAAVVGRYRSALFNDQQTRMKSGSSELDSALRSKMPPRFDGNLFYYELK